MKTFATKSTQVTHNVNDREASMSRGRLTTEPPAPLADGCVDNRSKAIAQRKLLETITQSPHVTAQRSLSAAIDNSPFMVAQRKQVSGMSGTRALQMKHTHQVALPASTQATAQLEQFDAGNGAQWHIHHDHIKLGNNTKSRVEFNGRSKKEIRKELGEKIDRHGLNVGGDLAASFRECIDYINTHF